MSWSFSLSGHSSEPHNEAVKAAFDECVGKLQAIPGNTVAGTGYTSDNSGKVDLVVASESTS